MSETGCEARVTVKLFKRLFPKLKFTMECSREATWIADNSCCGSTSRACEEHHKLATNLPKGGQLKCGECGSPTVLIWRKL